MTRGLYPPETLSKDDIRTLASVRREIWTNAIIGGGFGLGSGLILHTGAQWARKLGILNAKLNKNTAMLSILGGGAFGMFLFAARTGKQEVHNLHPIFQVGAVPRGELGYQSYQRTLEEARRGEEDSLMEKEPTLSGGDDDLDFQKMKQIRVARRTSLMNSLTNGQGLSDSHGGQWFEHSKK